MLKNVGALWKRVGKKSGKTFLSGVIEVGGVQLRVNVFREEEKRNERGPDYRIAADEAEIGGFLSALRGKRGPAAHVPEAAEDDLPF